VSYGTILQNLRRRILRANKDSILMTLGKPNVSLGLVSFEASLAASTLLLQLDEVIDLPFTLDPGTHNDFGYANSAAYVLETEKDQYSTHDDRSKQLMTKT
jgi:hypothetical protein